jgi:hypothetical protein
MYIYVYTYIGPVWQISWAHPKFGTLLASCSYDGSVIIHKEGIVCVYVCIYLFIYMYV